MVQFFLIRVGFRIRLADTFCNNFRIAFFVASIFAVLALHSCGVFKKVSTESATHDVVKLLEHEFVAVQFVNLFLSLTNSAFAIESNVKWSSILDLFGCLRLAGRSKRGIKVHTKAHRKMDSSDWL